MSLNNRVAILTGACGGIGLAIVDKLITEGARVLAVDLSDDALSALESRYPDKAIGHKADVTSYADVEAMIARAHEAFGRVDIVINNAGIGAPKPLLDHDPVDDFDGITAVNQKGVYHGILAAGRYFRDQQKPGVVINTSSVYGQMASELTFTYNVSKAAVDMMTKCGALELSSIGVRVCAVAPGRVDTPLLRKYEELGLWDHIQKEQMRKEFTQPAEIANVVAFLASEEANCINGCTVCASDGFENFKYPLMG